MSNDINASVIVSYVKHWDNNTKGTMEFPNVTIGRGVMEAIAQLTEDAIEDGVDGDSDTADLFTITKAEFGVPTNWMGLPAGL